MKGSAEIGFTVVAITFSLIAVFIALSLMRGYVGLLFREFAIAVSAALLISLVISRTLTPMMCAYLLKPQPKEHGWLYRLFERGFHALLNVYQAGLRIVLRHRLITLMVMFGTIALKGYLYVIIPKGFFPQQDTGLISPSPRRRRIFRSRRCENASKRCSMPSCGTRRLSPWARPWVRAAGSMPSMTAACSFSSNPMASGRRSGR